jgi:ABC-type antimicrobial peptide transport system permease subunit
VSATDAGSEGALLAVVRKELLAADPRLPILSSPTLRGHRDGSLDLWLVRTAARLFTLFGGIALFMAVIGLYGMKAYVVARRTREIGIRMALGASPGNVLGLVLGEGLALTGIGLGLGLILALLAGRVVSSMLYRVGPYDPLVIVGASLLLGGAALLAAYLPARRATRVTPLTALRSE